MTTTAMVGQLTKPVWIILGCMIIAGGVGGEVILFRKDVFDGWPLAFHGPFWLWAAITLAIAASTRFAAWVLLFGWIVMIVWSVLVAMATGLDILLIQPALLSSIVHIVAFLGKEPRAGMPRRV